MRRSVSGGSPKNSRRIQNAFSINSTLDPVIERLTSAVDRKGFSICFRNASGRVDGLWDWNGANRPFIWQGNSSPNMIYGM
jgi:hypothetical protein